MLACTVSYQFFFIGSIILNEKKANWLLNKMLEFRP